MDKIAKIPKSVDLENLPGSCAVAKKMPQTTPPEEPQRKHGRVTALVFIEMLCVFLVVTGVNMKLADDRVKKESLTHVNDAFQYHVKNKWDTKQWVDQHGVEEDKKTAEKTIQESVHDTTSDTEDTAISYMFDHITKLARHV